MPVELGHRVGLGRAAWAPASLAGRTGAGRTGRNRQERGRQDRQGKHPQGCLSALTPAVGWRGWGEAWTPPSPSSPSKRPVGATTVLETSMRFRPIHITRVHPPALPIRFPWVNPLMPMPGRVFTMNSCRVPLQPRRCPRFGFPLAGRPTLGVQGSLLHHEPSLQQSCQPQGRLGDSWEQDVSQPAKFNPPTLARLKIGSLQHR